MKKLEELVRGFKKSVVGGKRILMTGIAIAGISTVYIDSYFTKSPLSEEYKRISKIEIETEDDQLNYDLEKERYNEKVKNRNNRLGTYILLTFGSLGVLGYSLNKETSRNQKDKVKIISTPREKRLRYSIDTLGLVTGALTGNSVCNIRNIDVPIVIYTLTGALSFAYYYVFDVELKRRISRRKAEKKDCNPVIKGAVYANHTAKECYKAWKRKDYRTSIEMLVETVKTLNSDDIIRNLYIEIAEVSSDFLPDLMTYLVFRLTHNFHYGYKLLMTNALYDVKDMGERAEVAVEICEEHNLELRIIDLELQTDTERKEEKAKRLETEFMSRKPKDVSNPNSPKQVYLPGCDLIPRQYALLFNIPEFASGEARNLRILHENTAELETLVSIPELVTEYDVQPQPDKGQKRVIWLRYMKGERIDKVLTKLPKEKADQVLERGMIANCFPSRMLHYNVQENITEKATQDIITSPLLDQTKPEDRELAKTLIETTNICLKFASEFGTVYDRDAVARNTTVDIEAEDTNIGLLDHEIRPGTIATYMMTKYQEETVPKYDDEGARIRERLVDIATANLGRDLFPSNRNITIATRYLTTGLKAISQETSLKAMPKEYRTMAQKYFLGAIFGIQNVLDRFSYLYTESEITQLQKRQKCFVELQKRI